MVPRINRSLGAIFLLGGIMATLNQKYDHKSVESDKYQSWLENKLFKSGDKSKPPFSIVIPPPNVTGKLHLGHAWDSTLQDLLIRYKRLKGFDALWLPGMDHAGIATQAKVEQKLREQKISRFDLGREEFLKVAWSWKEEYATHIRSQWAKLGLALDYSRERFTLDEGLSNAVKEVFIKLYNEGLIYRGERIINWDPVQKTALSNIEVIYEETKSKMYYFKYLLADSKTEFLTVATTRPETMFGDVCLVVNPTDPRYKGLVGKKVINPSNNEIIPIIADEYVEIGFGTGAMKCTPAHDLNDFNIGQKYKLKMPICMNPDGTMNQLAHKYKTMDRFACRKQLVEDLTKSNLVVKIEEHINQVGYSERSHAVVEPYLSKQWFVKMKPLAEAALKQQASSGKVEFVPPRFEKIFTNWLEGVEDWCISRQLWWGHRIPAYYHKVTGKVFVGKNAPMDIENYLQDDDVLDTWFSSALWPFTTLGWPVGGADFDRYYPTDVLVTGYDIIFFWVSRMIFQGIKFTKEIPFKTTLIHGLIRDSQGRKMSKSLGNGVDPMDVIEEFGADALRFFLTTNSAPGLDLRYFHEKVEASWNFINKIWNASRFVMMNIGEDFKPIKYKTSDLNEIDKWLLSRLSKTINDVETNMDKFEFVVAGSYLYNFIWDDYCSWYIEMTKVSLNGDNEQQKNLTKTILFEALEAILKMIHPFMPFVSDEIYQTLNSSKNKFLIQASWPDFKLINNEVENYVNSLIETIKLVRNYKSENNLAPNAKINLILGISDKSLNGFNERNKEYLLRFGFLNDLKLVNSIDKKIAGQFYTLNNLEVLIPTEGSINVPEEISRIKIQIETIEKEIARAEGMLKNPGFTNKAPANKIEEEKKKLQEFKNSLKANLEKLNKLKSLK
jgi:valyl-tRNA synthetase